MVESLGGWQYGRKAACEALVRGVGRGISGVMPRGLRLSIVIANQCCRDGAVAAFQPRYIPIQRQILSVLVMRAVADHVPGIVQERAGLQQHTRMRW